MGNLIKEYDLKNSIKPQTFKLTSNSENKITFKNDMEGQVVYKELNNKIAIVVYETAKILHSYTKTVQFFDIKDDSDKCAVTSVKYVWTEENNVSGWKQVSKNNYVVSKSNLPGLVSESKPYQVEYLMTSVGDGSESSHTSTSALAEEQLAVRDASYKDHFIDKYGSESKTLSENVEAILYIDKGNIAKEMLIKGDNLAQKDLLTETYTPQKNGDKYTGMYLDEVITSSEADETFDLKTGADNIRFAFFDGMGKVGNDVIKLAKDEILTLSMLNSTSNQTTEADDEADVLVSAVCSQKGNDLIMKYVNNQNETLGQTTIKNYFKVAQDNITLEYSGVSSEAIDYSLSLKEYLEYQDGVGVLGDELATKAQKITGNFLDNTIFGGEGNDTIKGVTGNNYIFAGKGDDKLYCGKDDESFFVNRGDATGPKGDIVYNADNLESIYFLDSDGDIDDGGFVSDHFKLTKKGNDLIINYNDDPNSTLSDEKVTFANYFKRNSEILNINDSTDISNLKLYQTVKGNVKGTNYNDVITLTGKSTVYTGDGNDTIKFHYETVTPGKEVIDHAMDKNVTTYIDGTGKKTFERMPGYASESGDMGNKTIVFQNKDAEAVLNLLGKGSGTPPASDGYIYTKSGNNLVIEGYYSGTPQYHYDPQDASYDSYGSYTIKDYFIKSGNNVGNVYIDGADDNHKLDLSKIDFLYQQGKKNKTVTFTDTQYNDYLLGGTKNDKYNFVEGTSENGTDKAVDMKGNDTYNVSHLSNSLVIDDKAGNKDALIVSDASSYKLYFDVSAENEAVSGVGKNLQIFENINVKEAKLSGGITIENYIDDYQKGDTVKTGAGCIESIQIENSTLNIDLNGIASKVAGWLSTKEYASTQDVIQNHSDEIAEMLTYYTSANPQ